MCFLLVNVENGLMVLVVVGWSVVLFFLLVGKFLISLIFYFVFCL